MRPRRQLGGVHGKRRKEKKNLHKIYKGVLSLVCSILKQCNVSKGLFTWCDLYIASNRRDGIWCDCFSLLIAKKIDDTITPCEQALNIFFENQQCDNDFDQLM